MKANSDRPVMKNERKRPGLIALTLLVFAIISLVVVTQESWGDDDGNSIRPAFYLDTVVTHAETEGIALRILGDGPQNQAPREDRLPGFNFYLELEAYASNGTLIGGYSLPDNPIRGYARVNLYVDHIVDHTGTLMANDVSVGPLAVEEGIVEYKVTLKLGFKLENIESDVPPTIPIKSAAAIINVYDLATNETRATRRKAMLQDIAVLTGGNGTP